MEAINSQMTYFFWNDQENNMKYHLSNWQSLAQEKEFGGMGVPDLRDLNMCLLASWVHKYHDAEGRLWNLFVAHLGMHHPFLKVCCGQLKLPN
jgi:hypothetical protein